MSLCVKLSSRRSSTSPPQTNNSSDEGPTDRPLTCTHTDVFLIDQTRLVVGLPVKTFYFFFLSVIVSFNLTRTITRFVYFIFFFTFNSFENYSISQDAII